MECKIKSLRPEFMQLGRSILQNSWANDILIILKSILVITFYSFYDNNNRSGSKL